MKENLSSFETSSEHIPTSEEVSSIFTELTKKEYKEIRKCEDQKGLYLLEIMVSGDLPNEEIKYSYMRKGRYKEGQISETGIHKTYLENGIPISGTSVARYVEGNWEII